MNVAIGVWTLVLGGVLVPGVDSSVDDLGGPALQEPIFVPAPVEPGPVDPGWTPSYPGRIGGSPGWGPGSFGRGPSSPGPGQSVFPSPAPAVPSAPVGEIPQANRRSGFQDSLIPFAPTDPSAASEQYPWGPPTAGAPPEAPATGQQPMTRVPSTSFSSPLLRDSAAYGRPRATRPAYRPRSAYDSFASQQARLAESGFTHKPAAFSPAASKPFQSYRRPRATSPYMELGRVDFGYDVIDPYNQYVKPQLDRQREAQQTGRDIRGLQNSVRNLGRQTQSLRGLVIPQYYMNHTQYYPGFGK